MECSQSEDVIGEPDVKVIILGDSAVGKSKLVERYLLDDYNPRRLSTHALTLYRKNITLGEEGVPVKVDFWDTAGQEKFNSMHPSYYYKADVCVLVFDVTRKQTYLNLKHWYQELRTYCPIIPCILVANKVDVDYLVTRKNFKFPKDNNIPFFFVSSADGTNVVKVFEEAVCAGLGQRKYGEKDFLSECLELFEDEMVGT
jgi:Rab-like protein 2